MISNSILNLNGRLTGSFKGSVNLHRQVNRTITTRFTREFNLRYPLVVSPMGGIAGPALASAVVRAGGMSFIGTGGQNPRLKLTHRVGIGGIVSKLEETRRCVADIDDAINKIGVGFLLSLVKHDPTIVDQVIRQKPRNLWLTNDCHFSEIEPLLKLCVNPPEDVVSPYDLGDKHKIFCQVSTVNDAVQCARMGVDVVIVRSFRAGGYTSKSAKGSGSADSLASLPDLIERTAIAFEEIEEERNVAEKNSQGTESTIIDTTQSSPPPPPPNPIPILLGAGSIFTSQDVREALLAGADGVVVGTCLAVSKESELALEEKMHLAESLMKNKEFEITNPDGTTSVVRGGEHQNLNLQIRCAEDIVAELMRDVKMEEIMFDKKQK